MISFIKFVFEEILRKVGREGEFDILVYFLFYRMCGG